MSVRAIDPAHVEWCAAHFALMREGGVWGIPRSGMIFEKREGKLVLVAEMPWQPEMAELCTAAQLREQQDEEFEAVSAHFGAAGIAVVKAETIFREP